MRQIINSKFVSNQQSVYWDFKGSSITVNEIPTKNEIEEFGRVFGKRRQNLIKV